jgi:hypothetical protein
MVQVIDDIYIVLLQSIDLTCHHAHNISTGFKASRNQATKRVTVNVPNVKGASIIIWICTGKKASSSKQMPSAPGRRVNLNISITPNNISSIPDRVIYKYRERNVMRNDTDVARWKPKWLISAHV